MRRLEQELRRAARAVDLRPPDGLRERVLARLEDRSAMTEAPPTWRWIRRAAAAALLLGVLSGGAELWLGSAPEPQPQAPTSRLLPGPVEWLQQVAATSSSNLRSRVESPLQEEFLRLATDGARLGRFLVGSLPRPLRGLAPLSGPVRVPGNH